MDVPRIRLSWDEYALIQRHRNDEGSRVLVIGDLHAPFTKEGYIDHCSTISDKYKCNKIVFIGDLIDNHYSSYHETDPDGHSAREELESAIRHIRLWEERFPEAVVCLGNHDRIPDRKAMTAGLSSRWIKSVGEVLETKQWKYDTEWTIDDVKYIHGEGRKAKFRAKDDMINVVQGHYHSEGYIKFFVGENYKIFACQVGCGIDRQAYAMAYGRHFAKPHLSCGVVINGTLPILEYMEL